MKELKWWQTAVFYQIYPRSFADSTGNGIGDLPGIIDRLDYLQWLGVDAIWLSPHYPSPQIDVGYDIADYTDVEPEYGNLDDFRRFLEGAHDRGMRVILDLVLNHTSDQHSWFKESRASRDSPKRDWYIWRDGKDGGPPNNWYSTFGGSAWQFDNLTGQYYYHYFLKEQPDLNWRNPEVKNAVFDAVRFWLDMGVDGFRLDAIDTIFEHPDMPDHSADYTQVELYKASAAATAKSAQLELRKQWKLMSEYQVRQPGIHELFRELRLLIDEYPERVLVGETDDISYYGDGHDELHLAFNFPLMRTERLTPDWIRANQEERISAMPDGAWPCNTLGNHDTSRMRSAFGDGEHDEALDRLHLTLILTLWGTPFLYYGEEIGMSDVLLEDFAKLRDTFAINAHALMSQHLELPEEQMLTMTARLSRDRCRTPMQWSREPGAGFCPASATTWLPINPNHAESINVADQKDDPDSLLNFYRRILAIRKANPALIAGKYRPLHVESEEYLAFLRQSPDQACLIVLNFSNSVHDVDFSQTVAGELRCVFSTNFTRLGQEDVRARVPLEPFEAYIGQIG